MEGLVIRETVSNALTDAVINRVAEQCHRILEEGAADDSRIAALRNGLAEAEAKVDRLYTAYTNAPQLRELPERIEEAERERDALSLELDRAVADRPEPIPAEYIVFWLEGFRNGDVGDADYCRRVVDALLDKVVVKDVEGGTETVLTFHISEPSTSTVFVQDDDGGASRTVDEHGLFFYRGGFGLVIRRLGDTLRNKG